MTTPLERTALRELAEKAERIYRGFVRESLNGVVCSIPDEGLETKPHRVWCRRCQQRYRDLQSLGEELRALAALPATPARNCELCEGTGTVTDATYEDIYGDPCPHCVTPPTPSVEGQTNPGAR